MYYTGNQLLSYGKNFNFICGDRFGGKSTFVQKYILKRAIQRFKGKSTDEFAILTRYALDIDTLCATYFDNTMNMFYPDYELLYKARKYYLKLKGADDKTAILIGYGFALNNATKMKSTSYPYITTMVLEEFMNLEGKYLKNAANPDLEVELLISLYSTIARGNNHQVRDNVKVFGVSNNFYINNPYFRYFGLIDRIVQNPFQRFYINKHDPQCIVEMTHNDVHLSVGRDDVNKGSKFIDLQNDLHIIRDPKIKDVLFTLTFDNKTFIHLAEYNRGYIAFSNNKQRPDIITFSCVDIHKMGIQNISAFKSQQREVYNNLLLLMNQNELQYDKLETYITLYNILHYSCN